MPRMTKADARDIAARYQIDLTVNFYTLGHAAVDSVLAAADERRYKKPKNANGSRGRYFFEYLRRVSNAGAE